MIGFVTTQTPNFCLDLLSNISDEQIVELNSKIQTLQQLTDGDKTSILELLAAKTSANDIMPIVNDKLGKEDVSELIEKIQKLIVDEVEEAVRKRLPKYHRELLTFTPEKHGETLNKIQLTPIGEYVENSLNMSRASGFGQRPFIFEGSNPNKADTFLDENGICFYLDTETCILYGLSKILKEESQTWNIQFQYKS